MIATTDARKGVLIIEQNEIDRGGLAVILSRAGYSVATVPSPQEAVGAAQAGPPGLILLAANRLEDVQEFLRRCRSDIALVSVPILLTAETADGAQLAQAFGVAGCLHKPFDEQELLREVRRYLG